MVVEVAAFYKQVWGGENRGKDGGVWMLGRHGSAERAFRLHAPRPLVGLDEARERDQMGRSRPSYASVDWGRLGKWRPRERKRFPSVRGSLSRAYVYGVAAVA